MNNTDINRKINNAESFIVADDGQYLGKLCLNIYDPESVSNMYGPYGSPYSPTSINNKFSIYGSPYSSLSPFNPYTATPPIIYLRGRKVGFISVNPFLYGSVNPKHIKNWMLNNNLHY